MGLFDSWGSFATGISDAIGGGVNFATEFLDDVGAIAGAVGNVGSAFGKSAQTGSSKGNLPGAGQVPGGSSFFGNVGAPAAGGAASGGFAVSTLLLFVVALVVVLLVARR